MNRDGVISAVMLHACVFVATLAWTGWSVADQEDYVQTDVVISGRQINAFEDQEEQVLVVLGDFKVSVGQRVVTGRDGVIWILTRKAADGPRHEIRVYGEGEAKLTEPGVGEIGGQTVYQVFFVQGGVEVVGPSSAEPLRDFPLYLRATKVRKGNGVDADAQTDDGALDLPGDDDTGSKLVPTLLRTDVKPTDRTDLDKAESDTDTDDSDSATGDGGMPFRVVDETSGADVAPDSTTVTTTKPKDTLPLPGAKANMQKRPGPVSFWAGKMVSEEGGEGGRRVTVFTEGIYLSQSVHEGEKYLELVAEEAVVFSQVFGEDGQPVPTKDTHHPQSTEQPRPGRETVVGVYLYGDVRVIRGEGFMRAEEVYYDFTTDRAVMINPVYRTVQEQRDIPIYVRAKEGRILSARETWFRDAKVSTSEFKSPTYHFGAQTIYMMDKTAYDATGARISQRRMHAKMKHAVFHVRQVPLFYTPYHQGDFEQGHTALRRISVGVDAQTGFNVRTRWNLFRFFGVAEPEGYDGQLHLNYRDGAEVGTELKYERENYTGYARAWGIMNQESEDEFGQKNKKQDAPTERGWVQWRHKQFLPRDWQMQFEFSVYSDRDYLQKYFRDEFWSGKEQETLLYAKKQRDNWAVDVLMQARLIRWVTQTESLPEVAGRIVGESMMGDQLTGFGEARAGLKRWRPAHLEQADRRSMQRAGTPIPEDSNWMGRLDARGEIDYPLHPGPFNVVPYVAARGDVWSAKPSGGKNNRLYGEVGVRANTHLWRIYSNAHSRFWDVNKLKHIITPEVVAWLAGSTADPDDLYPLTAGIEYDMEAVSGISMGAHQRLQTKRGRPGKMRTVDWMRLGVFLQLFSANDRFQPSADGRMFTSRPEYSLARNAVNIDYTWHISDATTFLAMMNWDIDEGDLGRSGFGFVVKRDPRLEYYVGVRTIRDLESAIFTLAAKYQINRKYSIRALQQYDFDYDGGTNLATKFTIVRKFPRWYVGMTVAYDARWDDLTVMLQIWPEGIPEIAIDTGPMAFSERSDKN